MLKITKLCECGCGIPIKQNNRFIPGHNLKVLPPEIIKKRGKKQSESLKLFNKLNPSVRIDAGKKISVTKNTPEGKLKSSLANLNRGQEWKNKLKGRKPHNYIPEENKPRITCLNCGEIKIVTPTVAKTKKYCNNKCRLEYITGKPMLNWNINSFHGKSGRGISGEYKGIQFRSSYELSFIKKFIDEGHIVKFEPFRIKLIDYLDNITKEYYKITKNRFYSPDYLIDNKIVIEIKPNSLLCSFEYLNEEAIYKMRALEKFCKTRNLQCGFITEDALREFLLSYDDIRMIPKNNIVFYKEKDRVRFRQNGY